MLEPDTRALLSDLLRPPPGFALSHAVGTSFTLTLDAALAVPLSLAGFRRSAANDEEADATGIVSAVHRAASRIDLFAQAGHLGLGAASDLVTVLEPMIHPVVMTPGRLFHPKVWFLEFTAGVEHRYRFICSSRNLTNDRTWDAVIALDGAPAPSQDDPENRKNDGMVRLLHWLAAEGRTAPGLSPDRRTRIIDLADRWQRIRWEHPPGARRVDVHTLGIGADTPPRLGGYRALIVSPFVTDDGLASLRARAGHETILVSRPEQLDRLDPASFTDLSMKTLDGYVDETLAESATTELSGLHAKIIVNDRAVGGSNMLIGSANATGPAWNSNVEVMVELGGSTRELGVARVAESLEPLIETYMTEGGAEASEDELADRDLDNAIRAIAATRVTLRVHAGDPYAVSIWAEDSAPAVPDGLSFSWRLVTRKDAIAGSFPAPDSPASIAPLSLSEITPFIVATLRDSRGRAAQTLLIAEILDDVPDRQDAIVASHLTSPGAFANFIRLMLQSQGGAGGMADTSFKTFASAFGGGIAEDGSGLLELLVRAAADNDEALVDIERVLSHFSIEDRSALPTGFEEVWASVIAALRTDTRR